MAQLKLSPFTYLRLHRLFHQAVKSCPFTHLLPDEVFQLHFGGFQDGEVGVGIFPCGEEGLVFGAGFGGVAGFGIGAGEA